MSKRKRKVGCKRAIYNCWTFVQLSYKPGSYKMKFSFAFSLALTGFFHNFPKGKARSFNFDVKVSYCHCESFTCSSYSRQIVLVLEFIYCSCGFFAHLGSTTAMFLVFLLAAFTKVAFVSFYFFS